MLVPIVKFVAFTLVPVLVMIWTTSPDLWSRISYSFQHVGTNSYYASGPTPLPPPSEDPVVLAQEKGWTSKGTPQARHLASWWNALDGLGFLLSLSFHCVLSVDTTSSGHPSFPLDGVLVDSSPRMGAKLKQGKIKVSSFVRIDNSSSLETRAQEQKSNPDPGFLWATGPVDRRTARPRFSGIEPTQADTKNVGPCNETSQTKEIIAPNGRLITAPNGGTDLATISFMNLKSTPATNQEPNQKRGTGQWPGPMTTTLKQDNQTQAPSPWSGPFQCPDEPLMENANLRSPAPPPSVFPPTGVPFGSIHFTNYLLKSEYKEYTPEKILKLDPLARIQSAIRYNQQGLGKFNYLPAYNLPMELPVTPKPMPASSPNLPTDHSGKLFGIAYITLTGVIDTIILAAGPWSWVRKSASYLLKLAPLLWWTFPAKTWPKLPLKRQASCLRLDP
ncbi:hypothetical protein DSO57_1000102 [Entomophthora muscae]|uniref:Uncharacterized protein n=1 Tax=Entomophthora muscae TaxID=34485 RepID=A0ACC2SMM6_9FUNG|nr:hypothetical protein DSO57_1000102 [Entomophthora muscae]